VFHLNIKIFSFPILFEHMQQWTNLNKPSFPTTNFAHGSLIELLGLFH
jgi:hypothetical protein